MEGAAGVAAKVRRWKSYVFTDTTGDGGIGVAADEVLALLDQRAKRFPFICHFLSH
jgi:hypothetical protein